RARATAAPDSPVASSQAATCSLPGGWSQVLSSGPPWGSRQTGCCATCSSQSNTAANCACTPSRPQRSCRDCLPLPGALPSARRPAARLGIPGRRWGALGAGTGPPLPADRCAPGEERGGALSPTVFYHDTRGGHSQEKAFPVPCRDLKNLVMGKERRSL